MPKMILAILFLVLTVDLSAISRLEIDSMHEHIYTLLDTNPDSALILTDVSLEYSKKIGYTWGEGNSLFIKGYIAKIRNELSQAMIHYLKALKALETLESKQAITARIKLLTNCGTILEDHYKYNEAVNYYEQAIELASKYNNEKRLLVAYYNRSSAYYELGDYNQALENARIALDLSNKQNDEYRVLHCLNLLGLIYSKTNNYDFARKYYQEIINYQFTSVTPSTYLGRAYHNLANSYIEEGYYKKAEQFYLLAVGQKELKTSDPEALFISYMDLADLYQKAERLEKSKEFGRLALQLYKDIPLKSDYYKIFEILRITSYRLKEHDQANHYSSIYQTENEKFLQEQKKVMELKEQFTMDLVMAGFHQEILSNQKINDLNRWTWGIAVVSLLILLAIRARNHWIKTVILREIKNIESASEV